MNGVYAASIGFAGIVLGYLLGKLFDRMRCRSYPRQRKLPGALPRGSEDA
jgi:hypothetical protein